MEFFHANNANAKSGAKICTNGISGNFHASRHEDDARGNAPSQLSAASTSLASGNVPSAGVQATAAVNSEIDSNTFFFSQEASSVFDKALEMHVAPTDDPPMWGDDLEDYMEVANMLGDLDDLSTSNDVASGDFYSVPNTKIATKQEYPAEDTYDHASLSMKDGGSLHLGNPIILNEASVSHTASSQPVYHKNVDTRIFEDIVSIGDTTPQAEGGHLDLNSGSSFDEKGIFDDSVPEDMLNLGPESPFKQEQFHPHALQLCPQPPTQEMPLVTPTKLNPSNTVDITLKPSKLHLQMAAPLNASVEDSSLYHIDCNPGKYVNVKSGSFNDINGAANLQHQAQTSKQDNHPKKTDALWKLRFSELEEFVRQHEHCYVPQTYFANPSLGAWVARQRLLMRQWEDHQGDVKLCTLTYERYQCLKNVGLESSIGKGAFGKLSSRNVSEWEKKFTALIKYRDANGTCNVPTKNNSLGRWVSNQRKKYRDFLADQGKGQEQDFGWDSELQNRFQRLKDAGFNFYVGKGGNQPYKKSC